MADGNLNAGVRLDKLHRVHHGSEDPVKGKVMLTYVPNVVSGSNGLNPVQRQTEFSGPIEVDLILTGVTQIGREKLEVVTEALAERTMFTKVIRIFDQHGQFKKGVPQEIPFEIHFPSQVDAAEEESATDLPPSVTMHKRPYSYTLPVRYTLATRLNMPMNDVSLTNDVAALVLYDGPRTPHGALDAYEGASMTEEFVVHSSEVWDTTKSLLHTGHRPKFAFRALCTGIPQHICVGEPLAVNVSIQKMHSDTTAATDPEISVESVTATITSKTKGLSPLVAEWTQSFQVTPGPFTKGDDYSKSVVLGQIPGIPRSYSHADITREYTLSVEVRFAAFKEKGTMHRTFPLVVHPPYEGGESVLLDGQLLNGPVTFPPEEAVPQYMPPPSYDASMRLSL